MDETCKTNTSRVWPNKPLGQTINNQGNTTNKKWKKIEMEHKNNKENHANSNTETKTYHKHR